MKNYFITATDTDAGKTLVASSLTAALVKSGQKVAVFKPISAGCENIDGKLVNGDALALQQQANCKQSIEQINPIAYEEPIAPHIAALKHNKSISCDLICNGYTEIQSLNADITITEGAGGWRLPLGNGEYLSEFVKQQNIDVILVVHMKLGCLNHAILTYESIINDGLNVVAWVANFPEEMPYLQENIEYLQQTITEPLIAKIGHVNSLDAAIEKIDISML